MFLTFLMIYVGLLESNGILPLDSPWGINFIDCQNLLHVSYVPYDLRWSPGV